jgi:hypothetical protein
METSIHRSELSFDCKRGSDYWSATQSKFMVNSDMTGLTSYLSRLFFILLFIGAFSMRSATAQPGGRLVVLRAPNFGWNLAFHLQIDGRSVANIVQGRHYAAWLPAGRHVLTVYKVPYVGYVEATSVTVNIQPGSTNVFTAMWDSGLVFLRPSGMLLSPGEFWQLRGDLG